MDTQRAGRSNRARAAKQLTADELFFYDNAGFSYKEAIETAQVGRIRCAKELALAELTAERLGWEVEWEWDNDIDDSWLTPEEQAKEHEWTCARLWDAEHKTVLAAIGGVVDATPTYQRVIEAELASEALAELNTMRVSAFAEPITA